MIQQLLLLNVFEFSTYVFATFVFLSTSLLFFDSWRLNPKHHTPLIRAIGFLLITLFYFTKVTTTSDSTILLIAQGAKLLGLILTLISLILEPLTIRPDNNTTNSQEPPKESSDQTMTASVEAPPETPKVEIITTKKAKPKPRSKTKHKTTNAFALPLLLPSLTLNLAFPPLLSLTTFLVSIAYWRQTTIGLFKQYAKIALAFNIFTLAELTTIAFAWQDTSNVFWSQALAQHSFFWLLHLGLLLLASIILGSWTWGYVRFRLQIQLFVIVLGSILSVFVIISSLFSFILIKNLENDALSHLKTDTQVFHYSLSRLQSESLSHATAIAGNPKLQTAIQEDNSQAIFETTSDSLISLNLASLVTLSPTGQVLMRAENKDATGDNLSTNPLIASALLDKPLSTFTIDTKTLIPLAYVYSAVPIKDSDQKIIGAVLVGFAIDNAFVDGVKAVTGLDTTIYANNTQIATTLISSGNSRHTGTLVNDQKVIDSVINNNTPFLGATNILNQPYYASFSPLTSNDKTVGMVFIGKPQLELASTAQKTIDSTLLGTAFIILFSLIPSFFLSRYLSLHLNA